MAKVKKENYKWQSRLLRFTAFTLPNNLNAETYDIWWKQVIGKDPSSKNAQTKTGEIVYMGEFETGLIDMRVLPLRIEFVYRVKEDFLLDGIPRINTLGELEDTLEVFNKISESWLKIHDLPEVHRLAFGAIVVNPVESHEEGYKRLSSLIPFKLDPDSYSNFLLQINKPTKSKTIKDLRINRLTKWVNLRLSVEMASVANPKIIQTFPKVFATQLELDVNTDKDNTNALPKDDLQKIFAELINNGLEIAFKGL